MEIFIRRCAAVGVALAVLLAAHISAQQAHGGGKLVRLATTTSTDNSGLIDHLAPQFERDTGYSLQVIAVGTGKALQLGKRGDVDVILVHAPTSEARFVADGHGVHRHVVMENDFIVVGPRDDPAKLGGAKSAADAFARLVKGKSRAVKFVSRGDDSGTHKKEMTLWRDAGVEPAWSGRFEVVKGMGKSWQIAEELQAYLLIDRGTWIFLRDQTTLEVVFQGDPSLGNPYGVIAVSPKRAPVNFGGAKAFIDWLTSKRGQRAIGDYTVAGTRLFTPMAGH